ncbi:MAG: MFS transporter [Chloroflexi bacterium]|nr:MFS transporter [Chloroflexota bacterium]
MIANRTARYSMFALLYFSQGAVLSFFTALNGLYLLSVGRSIADVGLMGTIALIPFVLKIFMGILSDRYALFGMGHRKPYILIGLLIQTVCLVLVTLIHPGDQFPLYVLTAFILQAGMALYDTCTDGLALDTTPESEQGTIQGLMVGGRALGVVVVSGVIGLLVQRTSWSAAFYLLAALTLLPLPLVWMVREGERPAERKFQWKAFKAFSHLPVIALGLLGALYSLIINGANELVNPFLQQKFSIGYDQAGFFTMVWGIGVVIGGLTGGKISDWLNHRRATTIAVGLSLVSIGCLPLIQALPMAWLLVGLFGLAYGFYETVYFAISMQRTDPHIAASMFSILMAIANIGTGIGLGVSGALADSMDYPITFWILAGLNLLALILLPLIFQARRNALPQGS